MMMQFQISVLYARASTSVSQNRQLYLRRHRSYSSNVYAFDVPNTNLLKRIIHSSYLPAIRVRVGYMYATSIQSGVWLCSILLCIFERKTNRNHILTYSTYFFVHTILNPQP